MAPPGLARISGPSGPIIPVYNGSDSMELSAYELEGRLRQFNKLIQELLRGRLNRNTFQPWEIEILLDIDSCDLGDVNRRELLKRYQKAANRYYESGGRTLLKLSEYLAKKHRRPTGTGEETIPRANSATPPKERKEPSK